MGIRKKWGLLIILITLSLIFVFVLKSFEKPPTNIITQDLYDSTYKELDKWSIHEFPGNGKQYNGAQYAWGWSYVGNSLIDMYKATGEEKYLELFVPQAEYIITQTDQKLGIESFTGSGLSLPVWSDRGYYTAGKFNYAYPVHTGMITLPILRFVDIVKENSLNEYDAIADKFLIASGNALAVHNNDEMWKDFSETEGFYFGHPYGEGIVSEANKLGIPNRISIYLAACGLFDKISGGKIYYERIEKSLNYFKNSLLNLDIEHDAYYWTYWKINNLEYAWEDISHGSITTYGLFILHEEVGFTVFTNKDFKRFANIVYKVIDDKSSPIKIRKFIHNRIGENKIYYSIEENDYNHSIIRWAFLGKHDKKALDKLGRLYKDIDEDMPPALKLAGIATYLNAQKN